VPRSFLSAIRIQSFIINLLLTRLAPFMREVERCSACIVVRNIFLPFAQRWAVSVSIRRYCWNLAIVLFVKDLTTNFVSVVVPRAADTAIINLINQFVKHTSLVLTLQTAQWVGTYEITEPVIQLLIWLTAGTILLQRTRAVAINNTLRLPRRVRVLFYSIGAHLLVMLFNPKWNWYQFEEKGYISKCLVTTGSSHKTVV